VYICGKRFTFAAMNPKAIIRSGILTNYCLGFCTPEEIIKIEALSENYPLIKKEIDDIRHAFEEQLLKDAIEPRVSLKTSVMRSVYKHHAMEDQQYAPLIDELISIEQLRKWVDINSIKSPVENYENLFISEMPSTEQVINFIVSAKKGHDTEVHEDFIEYLYVINGSCTMDFDGEKRSYAAGEIISIQPRINHSAVVTSPEPMLALVQRQMI
jgi:quercetin dioxygenase-like cupin family protein